MVSSVALFNSSDKRKAVSGGSSPRGGSRVGGLDQVCLFSQSTLVQAGSLQYLCRTARTTIVAHVKDPTSTVRQDKAGGYANTHTFV